MSSVLDVIGISGKAGSGKDYIASTYLIPAGYMPVSLADHFKITIAGRGLATYEEVFDTKPPHVRKLLQEEGTERGRNIYGEQVWCNTLEIFMRRIAERWGMNKFVVADVRFPNEVQWVQSLGGRVWRIEAPTRTLLSTLTPEARLHISETALDAFTGFNGVINNDPGADVLAQVSSLYNVVSAAEVWGRCAS